MVEKFLGPFCAGHLDFPSPGFRPNGQFPWTIRFPKTPATEAEKKYFSNLIASLHNAHKRGDTDFSNQGAVELAALRDEPVFLLGESGTGKEILARRIHERWRCERERLSKDKNFPDIFVAVNCAGLSEQLARTELFGHVAGSFSNATDHRLGKVLAACGVNTLHSGKNKPGGNKTVTETLKLIQDQIDSINQSLENYVNGNNQIHLQTALSAALSFCAELKREVGQSGLSLVAALEDARNLIQNAASEKNQVRDFHDRLIRSSNGKLRPIPHESLGIEYAHDYAIGTLFLDEFGDLPASVQSQLLRFLDPETGEIEPVGYPSQIRKIKVRLIVATSDPEIAAFYGVPYSGSPAKTTETARFRRDLLLRLKHQIIRVEPVTAENFERVFEDLIGRLEFRKDAPQVRWKKEAKDALQLKVTERLKDGGIGFGHRRELIQFLKLVRDYVGAARLSGRISEDFPCNEEGVPVVTPQVVERLWSAPMTPIDPMPPYPPQPPNPTLIDCPPSGKVWELSDFQNGNALYEGELITDIFVYLRARLNENVKLSELTTGLQNLRKTGNENLTEQNVLKAVNRLKKGIFGKFPNCGLEFGNTKKGVYRMERAKS